MNKKINFFVLAQGIRKAVLCAVLLALFAVSGFVASGVQALDGSNSLKVVTNIPLNKAPLCIAVNEQTNRVYVGTENSFVVINGETDTVITEIPIGASVEAIVANPQTNRIYVGTHNNVTVIDGATNLVVGTILEGVYDTYELAVNPVTNLVYICDWVTFMDRYDSVKVYNGANFQLITTVNIPDSNTHTTIERVGVTVNSNSNRVYATWRGANTLYMIEGNNHTIIKTVTPSSFSDTVMVNPYTNFVYVGTAVLNGETLEAVAQNYTGEIEAIDPVHNLLYTTNYKTLYVLNGTTHAVIDSLKLDWSLGYGSSASVNSNTWKLYLGTSYYNGSSSYNQTTVVSMSDPSSPSPPTSPPPEIEELALSTEFVFATVAVAAIVIATAAVILKRRTK